MVVADLLHSLGVGGSAVAVVVGLLAVHHLRSGLVIASKVATVLQIAAVGAVGLIIASAGWIPGVDLDPVIQLGVFLDWVLGLLEAVGSVASGLF